LSPKLAVLMYSLAIEFNLIEISVFVFSFLLLIGTIVFLRNSLSGLEEIKAQQRGFTLKKKKKKTLASAYHEFMDTLFGAKPEKVAPPKPIIQQQQEKITVRKVTEADTLVSLKQSFIQQQQYLANVLNKIEDLESRGQIEELKKDNEKLINKIDKLEWELEEKEEQLHKLQKQKEVTDQMSARLEDVQTEFLVLQQTMATMEAQANKTNILAMELEETKEAYYQLKNDTIRKQEKLQELLSENAKLYQQLADTEDKLSEANMQRQQLLKKTKMLEDLNNDFQTVAETNQKLQTELRRIGELESMLNMMMEERDNLLRRKS
jgi:DNA repair exonuclease SbcCD ATPase subunit